jgi:large subunit ribosomal protein L13
MKTYSVKAADIQRTWHVIDAEGQTLGRLATQVATLLLGKHKPMYAPHLDTGDFVIVVNAAKVAVTGRKVAQKKYYRHTQYPGGLREVGYQKMLATHPERVIEHAVKGMLPHNRLGAAIFRKLKVYAGPTHRHEAQVNAGRTKAVRESAQARPVIAPPPSLVEAQAPIPETVEAINPEETATTEE